MTPSSCAVSSLSSLITTETLINLSAFFFPRHERRGDFFFVLFFANLCLLISFYRRQGPVSSCWPFFFSCFQYHKAGGWRDCSQSLTTFAQIWKRKMMQKHRLQKNSQMLNNTIKSLSQPLVSCFLAVSVWRNVEKRLIAAGIKHVFVT